MSRPSLFWVDPEDISGLLGRLAEPGPPRPAARTGPPPPVASPAAPLVPERSPAPGAPAFELPQGPLDAKLDALLDWVRSFVVFEHAFVVDQEGLALVHESAPLELIAAASTLAETWDALRNRFQLAPESGLVVELDDRSWLQLLTQQTRWGRVSLGIVLGAPLGDGTSAIIREQMARALAD
ncbi:MAG: hypothetical protein KDD11_11650 [Acidobacteria bacterium]|nr:hypothetical protein [Acidobacteriota bacterium]